MKIKRTLKSFALLLVLMAILMSSFSIVSFAENEGRVNYDDNITYENYSGNSDANIWAGQGQLQNRPGQVANGAASGVNLSTSKDVNITGNQTTFEEFTINGDSVTISSGANVTNSTFNTYLGSTQDMNTLLGYQFNILCQISALHYMIGSHVSSTDTAYITVGGQSVAIPLISWTTPNRVNFDPVNGIITNTPGSLIYGTLGYIVQQFASQQADNFYAIGQSILYSFNNLRTDVLSGFSSIIDQQTYNYWTLTSNQTTNGETFTKTITSQTGTFHSVLLNRIEYLSDVLTFSFNRFFEWYYPLDVSNPLYWRYWNSDTQQQVNTNLADVLYEMTWYLGNLYILESASAALDNMESAVGTVTTTFETVEAQEEAVINSVQSHINSFNPNVSDFGAFRALPWMSNYLQQIYVSLGSYGLVITIGLFLGVCMQIIGYMRYK